MNSLEYTVLGGGTGTPMLLDGFATLKEVDPRSITVVVNTADDVLVSGARVCPDLDSVLYTLADLVDRDRWYGIQGDTATTHRRLNDLAPPGEEPPDPPSPGKLPSYPADSEFMNIGDRDRATHLFRSARLQRGDTLTETTRRLARRLGVASRVLPMSEDPVSSLVHTEQEGVMHLQEYLVRHASNPTPTRIHPVGLDDAKPTGPVLEALEQPVVIGPSNPVTSVEPILNLPGVRARLKRTRVLAVSPFLGREAFSGPAACFMRTRGHEPSARGMAELYGDVLDEIVLDERDETDPPLTVSRTDIRMDTAGDRRRVARHVLERLRNRPCLAGEAGSS